VYSASYDADGNMVTRNGSPITWTVDNLPESIGAAQGSSTFSYGPDGQRYYQSATDNGVTTDTTYIGSLFEVIAGQSSTEYRNNIFADGQVIAVHTIDQSGNATTSYLHYDHLGSVDTITNDQGTIAQQMSFDAFGLRRDAANWDYDLTTTQITALKNDTDRGYTFQEQLDNVGLIHMNGRVYDPSIGRFISADPTEGGNRYAYAYNNPLEFTDPSGYCSVSILGFSIFGGGEDCTEQAVSDIPGLSTGVNTVGDVASAIGQVVSHVGLVAQDHINQIIAVVVAYYTGDWAAGGGTWGAGSLAAAGAAYGGTDTALNGGNGTQVLESAAMGALEGYELGGAYQGLEMDINNAETNYWLLGTGNMPNTAAITGQWAAFQIGNVVAQQEVDRYASNHGMNPVELDAELFAFSFVGNALVGSRYSTNFEGTQGQVGIGGFFDNSGGALAGASSYVRGPLEFIFDSTDALLALQGIPTASAINLIESGYTGNVYGESLGSWDVANLQGYGYITSSDLYALPFGKIVAPGSTPFCQYDDPICGGPISLLLNPEINLSWGQGGIHLYCTFVGNGPC